MGLKMFSSDSSYVPPNPNPFNYQVQELCFYDENYTLAIIKYNGCTTYQGLKICVYDQPVDFLIKNRKNAGLDPHFLENNTSPIARFPASKEGKDNALAFLKNLHNEDKTSLKTISINANNELEVKNEEILKILVKAFGTVGSLG